MAKKFMFVCAGILMLAGAFALGARSVGAQSGGEFVGLTNGYQSTIAITATGDLYGIGALLSDGEPPSYVSWNTDGRNWIYLGNIFDQPVSSESESMGDVKSIFR